MSVHPDGLGSGWTQDVDVDQPHGLDYRYTNHLAIAVRSRIKQEHSDFADATVGGIHKPGGCAVLAMEEGTATVVADGTLRGRGLCWDLTSRLWCATAGAGSSTTGDWTLVQLHPDKQWGGKDVTWAGGHEFDASVDISGNVALDGDLTIDGVLKVDSSADLSDVFVANDISINGQLKVDGTSPQFGGTAGIGLFYDPTAYTGGETCTIGNGLIIKCGTTSTPDGDIAADNLRLDISFGTAFPNGVVSAVANLCTDSTSATTQVFANVYDLSTKGFSLIYRENAAGVQATKGYYWMAIGR